MGTRTLVNPIGTVSLPHVPDLVVEFYESVPTFYVEKGVVECRFKASVQMDNYPKTIRMYRTRDRSMVRQMHDIFDETHNLYMAKAIMNTDSPFPRLINKPLSLFDKLIEENFDPALYKESVITEYNALRVTRLVKQSPDVRNRIGIPESDFMLAAKVHEQYYVAFIISLHCIYGINHSHLKKIDIVKEAFFGKPFYAVPLKHWSVLKSTDWPVNLLRKCS